MRPSRTHWKSTLSVLSVCKDTSVLQVCLNEELSFECLVYVDILSIKHYQSTYAADAATHSQDARWLKGASTGEVLQAWRRYFIETYLGRPNIVDRDAERAVMSKTFLKISATIDIHLRAMPGEISHPKKISERCFALMQKALKIARANISSLDSKAVLQTAGWKVTRSGGQYVPVYTMLVYWAVSKINISSELLSLLLFQGAGGLKLCSSMAPNYFFGVDYVRKLRRTMDSKL